MVKNNIPYPCYDCPEYHRCVESCEKLEEFARRCKERFQRKLKKNKKTLDKF